MQICLLCTRTLHAGFSGFPPQAQPQQRSSCPQIPPHHPCGAPSCSPRPLLGTTRNVDLSLSSSPHLDRTLNRPRPRPHPHAFRLLHRPAARGAEFPGMVRHLLGCLRHLSRYDVTLTISSLELHFYPHPRPFPRSVCILRCPAACRNAFTGMMQLLSYLAALKYSCA